MVVILDQNMEYKEGTVKGTDLVAELRHEGFAGVLLIRSANDDKASGYLYRQAGANAYLSKKGNVTEFARRVVKECVRVWGGA